MKTIPQPETWFGHFRDLRGYPLGFHHSIIPSFRRHRKMFSSTASSPCGPCGPCGPRNPQDIEKTPKKRTSNQTNCWDFPLQFAFFGVFGRPTVFFGCPGWLPPSKKKQRFRVDAVPVFGIGPGKNMAKLLKSWIQGRFINMWIWAGCNIQKREIYFFVFGRSVFLQLQSRMAAFYMCGNVLYTTWCSSSSASGNLFGGPHRGWENPEATPRNEATTWIARGCESWLVSRLSLPEGRFLFMNLPKIMGVSPTSDDLQKNHRVTNRSAIPKLADAQPSPLSL